MSAFEPTAAQLEGELRRVRYRRRYLDTLRSTVCTLIVVAAVVLLAAMWLPVLRISGDSMADTLTPGDVVVAWRDTDVRAGDLIVFNGGNRKTLIKRVVGEPGDVIDLTDSGIVSVNGRPLSEPYVTHPAGGTCDLTFPYTVPQGRYFVLGDNREISLDSRSSAIGCIAQEQIVGRVVFRIWPIEEFGTLGAE